MTNRRTAGTITPAVSTQAGLLMATALVLAACAGEAPESSAAASIEAEASAVQADGSTAGVTADEASVPADALVNPNTADEAALAGVPGMTEELVAFVLAERPFEDMLEFDALISQTLDESQREALYGYLFVPLDLNAAEEAEILLIPGVGDRMAHEFEEYRPYDVIERFRREMAKYVDEAEVARLERYVEIR